MSKPLAEYNVAKVLAIAGGFPLSGLAEGSCIKVERNADAYTLQIGSDGEGARSKSNNKSGTITIRLQQTSDSNDILSAFAKADELTDAGLIPFMVKDGNGRTLCITESAWVRKNPVIDFANTAGEREWVLETNNIEILIGGV